MTDLEMAAFAEQVADNARRIFGPQASAEVLDQYAREAVLDLWMNGPKIACCVTEQALRHVRKSSPPPRTAPLSKPPHSTPRCGFD